MEGKARANLFQLSCLTLYVLHVMWETFETSFLTSFSRLSLTKGMIGSMRADTEMFS
jgi:hypothetical protein